MVAFQCLLFRANIVVCGRADVARLPCLVMSNQPYHLDMRVCRQSWCLEGASWAGALLLPSLELTWGRSGALLHNKNQAVQEAGVGGPRKGGGQGAGRSCRRAQVQLAGAEKVKFRTDGCKRSRASAPIVRWKAEKYPHGKAIRGFALLSARLKNIHARTGDRRSARA